MISMRQILKGIQSWLRRQTIREGMTLSRFVARDVRRDILVTSTARIEDGLITGRVRTVNVHYVSRGLDTQPAFQPAKELRIDEMWKWTGESWGGLPDGTSIVDRVAESESDELR